MLSGFGQFSSFLAADLRQDGTVMQIYNGKVKASDAFADKCKYLFYEIREDPANDIEGGYRVELSFEEGGVALCGIGGASGNQSILATFVLMNGTILEMRRIMGTNSMVHLGGTDFNVFKLIKLINKIKAKNAIYSS